MALGWYVRDRGTPGNPVTSISETAWRALVARYHVNVDYLELTQMVPDQHWLVFPDKDLWMSTTGTFNPTTSTFNPSANTVITHRKNFYTGVEH